MKLLSIFAFALLLAAPLFAADTLHVYTWATVVDFLNSIGSPWSTLKLFILASVRLKGLNRNTPAIPPTISIIPVSSK
jgi:hypothetical protein